MSNRFNNDPYFSDFDENKNYHKVLFKAGAAFQAREMNVIQDYARNQMRIISNHFFKNGSIISNARNNIIKTDYVTFQDDVDLEYLGNEVTLFGETTGLRATLIKSTNKNDFEPATSFIVYTNTAIDGKTNKFIPGETINFIDDQNNYIETSTIRCPSCIGSDDQYSTIDPVGFGHIFYIDEGEIYFEGVYIKVLPQNIIVSKYDAPKSVKIGLNYENDIVSFIEDETLFDNALNYPNATAIGADRERIELKLAKYPLDFSAGEHFILMMSINLFGKVEFQRSDTDYADLMDMLAKRTYETNGDYTIRNFNLSFLESLKKNENDPRGYNINGNADKLIAVVTPSIAYVKGFRVETITDSFIEFPKARDTNQIPSYIKRFDERTYIEVEVLSENTYPNGGTTTSIIDHSHIDFYDSPVAGNSPTGNIIGQAKVSDLEIVDANKKIYKLFIFDLQLTANSTIDMIKSICNTDNQFISVPVKDELLDKFVINNANRSALIFQIDREHIKTLRSIDNNKNGSISIKLRKMFKSTLDAAGGITFNTITNEFFESIDHRSICVVEKSGVRQSVILNNYNSSSSPTTLNLRLGAQFSGGTCTLIHTILRTNQKEKTKMLVESSITSNDAPENQIGYTYPLRISDAYELKSVGLFRLNVITSQLVFVEDVTHNFKLNKNITDYAYNESSIEMVQLLNSSDVDFRLQIEFSYFAHSGNTGYFNVDSYSDVFNDSSNSITYENISDFVSPVTKMRYNLTQSMDFRPIVMSYNDPIVSITPGNNDQMIFDIEYYLPRTDLLSIDKQGTLYVKPGIASETPRPPKVDNDAMALYEIWLPAYTYDINDVRIKFIQNKRFTMRDIGKIETRVENIETYVSLSLLEKSAADMSVTDAQGRDRFKNGFLADNFKEFQAADLGNPEFKAALDRKSAELRPRFKSRNRKLIYNALRSAGCVARGNMLMFNYTHVVEDEQPFATKSVSINPYLISQKKGNIVLMPNNDLWSDDTKMPEMVHGIDTGTQAIQNIATAAGVFGTSWGTWSDQNSTIIGQSQSTTSTATDINLGIFGTNTVTNTTVNTNTVTAVNQVREGVTSTVGSRTDSYSLGEVVRDVRLQPFIRNKIIQFYASGLAPSTVFYPYFDNIPISKYCRDIGNQITDANVQIVSSRMNWGGDLISNANGELLGEFNIPANTFFTGQRNLTVTTNNKMNVDDDSDLSWSFATGEYYAGGLDVEKQAVTLNVISPTFNQQNITESRTDIRQSQSSNTTTTVVNRPPVVIFPPNPIKRPQGDPMAQGFMWESDGFLPQIDIYMHKVDLTATNIWVQIRTMANGYPTETVIAEKIFYDMTEIKTSEDSSVPFPVIFDSPVFIEGKIQYCWVIGGDSPMTRVFIAVMNQSILGMPNKIVETQPNGYSSFRSQNGSTWNAEQYETLKYKLYSCKFDISNNLSVMFNQENESEVLDENPIETEVGSNAVRIYCADHGFTENDKFNLSMLSESYIKIKITDTNPIAPQIGQEIRSISVNGTIIDSYKVEGSPDEYMIRIKINSGKVKARESFVCLSFEKKVNDKFILNSNNSSIITSTIIPEINGSFLTDFDNVYPSGLVNGVPLSDLNREHFVKSVDSLDSFIIDVNTPAKFTGRTGGKGTLINNFNHKFDVFNISGAYLPYSCEQQWEYRGIGHGLQRSKFAQDNYSFKLPISINIGDDTFLEFPNKIAGNSNEARALGLEKSVNVVGSFTSHNDRLSPILNIDTFSIITVSNIVGWATEEDMNVAPNGHDRFIPEDGILAGSENFKYVTREIILEIPAEDVVVIFDVYKNLDADYDIFIKRLPVISNGLSIDSVKWEKFIFDKSKNSFDLTDRTEYKLIASRDIPDWADSAGEVEPFSIWKIKIVGRSLNSCKPPLFRSLRCIAMT